VDASNQASLTASQLAGQNLQQDITSHNVPMQQMQSLYGMGSGQPTANYVNTGSYGINPVDVSGLALGGYQGQLAGYNAQVQAAMQQYQAQMNAQQGTMGGLFGLGGSVLGGLAMNRGLFGLGGLGPDGLPMSGLGTMTGNAALNAARAYGPVIV
jgi:hypothetical protein